MPPCSPPGKAACSPSSPCSELAFARPCARLRVAPRAAVASAARGGPAKRGRRADGCLRRGLGAPDGAAEEDSELRMLGRRSGSERQSSCPPRNSQISKNKIHRRVGGDVGRSRADNRPAATTVVARAVQARVGNAPRRPRRLAPTLPRVVHPRALSTDLRRVSGIPNACTPWFFCTRLDIWRFVNKLRLIKCLLNENSSSGRGAAPAKAPGGSRLAREPGSRTSGGRRSRAPCRST